MNMNVHHLFIILVAYSHFIGHCLSHGQHHEDQLIHHGTLEIIQEHPSLDRVFTQGLTDIEKWLQSDNLAQHLELKSIQKVSLPIKMNIIFVGFDGDGNNEINLSNEYLKPWFEHLEHSLPHLTVPYGEEQTTTQRQPTPSTAVELSLALNVVRLCPMVNTLLEDALFWGVRPEETEGTEHHPHEEKQKYYTDAFRFSSVLHNLLYFLNETDTYTLFVLNPKSPVESWQLYGYRTGFSDEEISLLYQSDEFDVSKAETTPVKETKNSFSISSLLSDYKKNISNNKIQYTDMVKESEQWAQWYLTNQRKGLQVENRCAEEDDPSCAFKPIQQKNIIFIAREIAANGSAEAKEYLYDVQNDPHIHEECLVDTWIGHGRFAFIDLTAGPLNWGPTISGEGVRSLNTLPTVPGKKQLEAEDLEQKIKAKTSAPSSQSRFAAFKAEADLLKVFWNQYCQQKQQQESAFCEDLEKRIRLYSNENGGRVEEGENQEPILVGGEEEGMDGSIIMDGFLSQLASTISSSIRHLVAPPTPLYNVEYAERVGFDIFIIRNHNEYNPRDHHNFNYDTFKREIQKLKIPGQEFSFTLKEIALGSDPSLALALGNSLKSATQPRLSPEGIFSSETVLYLDSKEIQYQLKVLHQTSEDDDVDRYSSKKIPIFFFSLDYDHPVFIDKHYQAKALQDMVLVVQSNMHSWGSKISCNGKIVYWNLRNPLKPLLSATSTLLGGLIPTHLTYNEATQSAQQNWLWSVGDNPFAYTSSRAHFSTFQKDILSRNYIISALNDSLTLVNEGILLLSHHTPTMDNYQALNYLSAKNLKMSYEELRNEWTEVALAVYQVDFPRAVKKLSKIHALSKSFYDSAQNAVEVMNLYKCITPTQQPKTTKWDWLFPIAVAINVAVLIIRRTLLQSKSQKVKIN